MRQPRAVILPEQPAESWKSRLEAEGMDVQPLDYLDKLTGYCIRRDTDRVDVIIDRRFVLLIPHRSNIWPFGRLPTEFLDELERFFLGLGKGG